MKQFIVFCTFLLGFSSIATKGDCFPTPKKSRKLLHLPIRLGCEPGVDCGSRSKFFASKRRILDAATREHEFKYDINDVDDTLGTSVSISGTSVPIAAIVGGAIGAVLLIGFLVFVCIKVQRSSQLPEMNYKDVPWPPREVTKTSIYPDYVKIWKPEAGKNYYGWTPFIGPLVGNKFQNISPKGFTVPTKPGIYEFGLVHRSRPDIPPVVVYVGKAAGKDGIMGRHTDYLTPKNHIIQEFQNALDHGCLIYRRFITFEGLPGGRDDAGDRLATQLETRCLSYFDYAFNKNANRTSSNMHNRMLYLKPRYFLWCIPAGISICNPNPQPPFAQQVPKPGGCFCDAA